jgi:hypothetical protein
MSEPIARAAAADHTAQAAATHEDPDFAGRVAAEAARLEPLARLQVALDQLAGQAEDRRRGLPWPFDTPYEGTVVQALAHAGYLRDILRCAATAADTMIEQLSQQVSDPGATMTVPNPNEGPRLTTTGEPHPLQEGGYDPAADPAKPGNISDIEALKEGKATPAQVEALAAADVAASEERKAEQERQAAQQPQRQQPQRQQPQQAPGAPAPPQRASGPGQPGGPTPPGQAPRPADPKQTPKR